MTAKRPLWAYAKLLVSLLVLVGMAALGGPPLRAQDAPAETLLVQVLPLRYANAVEVLQAIQPIQPEAGVTLTASAESNALVVRAAASTLEEIRRLVAQLDAAAADVSAERPPRVVQLRMVWLVGGLADDAAAVPPEDLEAISHDLAQRGVTNLTMAAQLLVSITEGETFSVSGTAKVNEPCLITLTGRLGARDVLGRRAESELSLRLDFTATSAAGADAPLLCQLQTTVQAPPPGQSTVLGITPVGSKPAVFVVEMLPDAAPPEDVKKD
ncbi:MAG: hypothetical protein GXY58_08040 [Planctomycetaceae bacterium]|nr:hypothetical protein [Planctomycetaceae bacterium]